jgi:transketolase
MSSADASTSSSQPTEPDAVHSTNAQTAINALRFLAVDMVQAANSGHPGAPMGQAPMAYLLFAKFLRFDPGAPQWANRDRFVLSCGHASALLYGVLHLAGFELPLDELRNFRQWGSRTPGHPEYGHTPGVDTTTGPLGQGISTAVGMAMAERLLAQRFNREGFELFDHHTWVLASDGDLMEGVASEACSLAGHQRLGKLNVLYDANQISIDGSTDLSFTEDVGARFRAYGWHTLEVADGTDLEALSAAMQQAQENEDQPTLISVRTVIGHGSPNRQGTAKAHGEPLGEAEAALAKEALGWPKEPTFHVPETARAAFHSNATRGAQARAAWHERIEAYAAQHGTASAELQRRMQGLLPELDSHLPRFEVGAKIATRKASGQVLAALQEVVPELVGGSADLTGSNNTWLPGEAVFEPGEAGRNVHFGVREHAMAAAVNGMVLSGLLRGYGGTFLIFSDYMRPAIRLAALMGLPSLFVLTHDSIFLGEDGPTHQPISQLAALRAIPGVLVLRPADANETAAAWKAALEYRAGPSCLILTRQGLPVLEETQRLAAQGVARGAYVLREAAGGDPEALLLATGSEVWLALAAQRLLEAEGRAVRVVSMPSWELFARQPEEVRNAVLPPSVEVRLAVEAASPFGWERWVGLRGGVAGVEGFGASAPYADLQEHYGFTPTAIAARLLSLLEE